jgi:DNA-binding FadR family transcriptional regulator
MNTITKEAYEGDIVSRLKNWRGLHLAHVGELFDEAAVEITTLREAIRRLADQDATLSVQGGNVTVTLDATLTDKERDAIKWAYSLLEPRKNVGRCAETAATLRNLLERTK